MGRSRREKLEAMLAEEPNDVFLRYSLAWEWIREDQPERALAGLQELMEQESPYVPAFSMAGQILAQGGQVEQARQVLRLGIEQARQQGETHAAGEMAEFLTTLGYSS